MGTTLLQIPIDDSLNREAALVFENLGSDTPTAVRSFLQQAAAAKSASFTMTLPQDSNKTEQGRKALLAMNEVAEKNGLSDMTLAEINAEIAAARRARTSAAGDGK